MGGKDENKWVLRDEGKLTNCTNRGEGVMPQDTIGREVL